MALCQFRCDDLHQISYSSCLVICCAAVFVFVCSIPTTQSLGRRKVRHQPHDVTMRGVAWIPLRKFLHPCVRVSVALLSRVPAIIYRYVIVVAVDWSTDRVTCCRKLRRR